MKLLSQERRRRAVVGLHERYRASERQACRVVYLHRSQRHSVKDVSVEEGKLRNRMREVAALLQVILLIAY